MKEKKVNNFRHHLSQAESGIICMPKYLHNLLRPQR